LRRTTTQPVEKQPVRKSMTADSLKSSYAWAIIYCPLVLSIPTDKKLIHFVLLHNVDKTRNQYKHFIARYNFFSVAIDAHKARICTRAIIFAVNTNSDSVFLLQNITNALVTLPPASAVALYITGCLPAIRRAGCSLSC
jgi:hypothetical protein